MPFVARLLIAARGTGSGGASPGPDPEETDAVRGTSVKRTTNLTTGANNDVVTFDTEEYDDDGIWSVGDPAVLGPMPASYNGKRAVFYATVIWSNDISGYGELKIFRNGDTDNPIAVVQMATNAFNTGVELTSRPIVLATGDEFELCARSSDAGTALAAEDYSLTFSVEVRGV